MISNRRVSRPIELLNKLTLLGTVSVWLALLAGLLGRAAWPLDLFAHFRIQYAVLFILLAATLLILRRWIVASVAMIGLVVSVIPLLPYLAGDTSGAGETRAPATSQAQTFRLLTFNVWFRNPDIVRVATYIESSQADAVVLQELTATQAEALRPLLPTYPNYYIEPSRMGAAVFTRWPVLAAESVPLAKDGAVAARMQIAWRGVAVTVFGVHLNWPLGPRNSAFRNEELRQVVAFAKAHPGPLLVAGDFNLTPWSQYFRAALAESGLHDAARGFGLHRSWPAQFAPLALRIDHCLVSHHWRSVSAEIGPWLGSDHLPLVTDLQLQP